MRVVRFGPPGAERPGLLTSTGEIRDLSAVLPDWDASCLSPACLASIRTLDPQTLPPVPAGVRLGVPWRGIGKFIAIGMNYTDFAAEVNRSAPQEPVIFTKAVSCITGPDAPVVLPPGSVKTDWEVELGVVIGTRARYVSERAALRHVAGYCLVNDLSEREYQNERGGTWDKGKGCDTFGPVGPWLVCTDEINDPQEVDLWLEVNGTQQQKGHTRNMFFPVAHLIAYVSQFMTLEPGDLLATGTPAGVGANRKPDPVYLRAGDEMRLGSSRLGTQQHRVIPWRKP
jgi:2,4-didehydro-3-deoxy-L-rhamnonate hydrolase